eukprot:gene8240-9782_t
MASSASVGAGAGVSIRPKAEVVLIGLKSAGMNGQWGVTGAALNAKGRWPVTLESSGKIVAIKPENLQVQGGAVGSSSGGSSSSSRGGGSKKAGGPVTAADLPDGEFDDGDSPDLLSLYFHYRDKAFDCYNAKEYTAQLIKYYANNISVVLVVPRKIRGNDYLLVGMQHSQHEKNSLCQVAFQCKRQFCGISFLLKKKCFWCNKPAETKCTGCLSACFCSKQCQTSSWPEHKKLCNLVTVSSITTEDEVVVVEV